MLSKTLTVSVTLDELMVIRRSTDNHTTGRKIQRNGLARRACGSSGSRLKVVGPAVASCWPYERWDA